jgi:hypothetical protein
MKSQIPNHKSQIILNNQIQITQKVWILMIGNYLDIGLPARSRLGEGRCLGFGV